MRSRQTAWIRLDLDLNLNLNRPCIGAGRSRRYRHGLGDDRWIGRLSALDRQARLPRGYDPLVLAETSED